jgi:hypothetical protein
LKPLQVEQPVSELRFVSATVDDPLLNDQISALVALSQLPSHGVSKDSFGLEFPSKQRADCPQWARSATTTSAQSVAPRNLLDWLTTGRLADCSGSRAK